MNPTSASLQTTSHLSEEYSPGALSSPSSAPEISLILPVYNEEESIGPLHAKLLSAMAELGLPYEILYVDDGSRDRSFEILSEIAQREPQVKLIRFRRNFGQTAAMAAGFRYARGRVLIPLDADGQNDPADIARLLEKINEGYDVVSGWRHKRKDNWLRRLPSRIANGLISRVTGVFLHDYGCSLKAYRAEIIKDVELYGEMHRFIPAYAAMVGGRVTEIPVNHHPRVAGKSKYGMSRIFRVLLDLLVARFFGGYGSKPIYFFGGASLWLFGSGGVLWLITLAQRFGLDAPVRVNRNPLFYVGILCFLMAMQLVMMGLLAEMSMRTYYEAQQKQPYVMAEMRNLELKS